MGDETLIGLLQVMLKTHPLLIKRIEKKCLDHVSYVQTFFPAVKLAKVESDKP